MKKSLSFVLSLLVFVCSFLCTFTATVTAQDRYGAVNGGVIKETVTENVYYSRRDMSDSYENPYGLPGYFASGIENACAITAGGAIIGYFDRYYEELIPNHTTIMFMGYPTYSGQDAAVNAMHQELYQRMGSTSQGTTVQGYKNGMISYAQSKGRNMQITSIYSNASLNKSAYVSALNAGKLLTVFLDGFCLVGFGSINTNDGYDIITGTIVQGLHTVAAYGYRTVKYYDASDNLVQTDEYLLVHSGFASAGMGMIRLNKYTTVDDGYIINIT